MLKRRAAQTVAMAGLLVAVLTTPGCGDAEPDRDPDLRGVVTTAEASDSGGSVRVIWTEDAAVGALAEYDAAQVAVNDETVLRRRSPDSKRQTQPLVFAQLSAGDVVEVWFTGAVAESYPVQATAERLELVGRYEGELPVPPGLELEPAP